MTAQTPRAAGATLTTLLTRLFEPLVDG